MIYRKVSTLSVKNMDDAFSTLIKCKDFSIKRYFLKDKGRKTNYI